MAAAFLANKQRAPNLLQASLYNAPCMPRKIVSSNLTPFPLKKQKNTQAECSEAPAQQQQSQEQQAGPRE